MRQRNDNRGYTIVEVMIFLAVSGLMFFIAAGFISGKQANAEFKQSSTSINAELQKIANDVGNGLFPVSDSFKCSTGGAGAPVVGSSVSKGCVYMGKVITFNKGSSDYKVLTVLGRQYQGAAGERVATTFKESYPTVAAPLNQSKQLGWGMQLKRMKDVKSGDELRGIGFFTSFGNYKSNGALLSGGQSVWVVPIKIGVTDTNLDGYLYNADADSTDLIQAQPHIEACFDSGNGKFAKLTFGGEGKRLVSRTQVVNGDCSK